MSIVLSQAILVAITPYFYQGIIETDFGFRQAEDCFNLSSCTNEPYGVSKWNNGKILKTSTYGTEDSIFVESGEETNGIGQQSLTRNSDLYGSTGSFTTNSETLYSPVDGSIFANSHRPHRPSKPNGRPWDDPSHPPGNPCDNPGKGRPPFCNPEPEYPEPIPVPAPILFLLTALTGFGVFKMFQKMDDLENIR